MKNFTLALMLMASPALALDPAQFFANPAVQAQAPGAFAVQDSAKAVLEAVERIAPAQRQALVDAIRADHDLSQEVAAFGTIGWARQLAAIKKIMALECAANGCAVPPLVVHDNEAGHGPAFFEFDTEHPDTGKVHLWPLAFADEASPYAPLMFAVHETRHSWQFQLAFTHPEQEPALAAGFAAGFRAQKSLGRKLSYCDFCTMHHEHEAFQTGNLVVGMLTGFTVDTAGMGCLSSMFDAQGVSKIDLLNLFRTMPASQILTTFNTLENPQFISLGGHR